MTTKKRVLIGAIGGITPYLLTLAMIDVEQALRGFDLFAALGLAMRCLVLIFAGALVAYFHETEQDEFKLFQLGVAAPALLATGINGYSAAQKPEIGLVPPTAFELPAPSEGTTHGLQLRLIGAAHAEGIELPPPAQVKNTPYLQQRQEGRIERFWQGLVGAAPETRYFVIAGTHAEAAVAQGQAEALKAKGYAAEVLPPDRLRAYYAVAIGTHLTLEQAQRLRAMALKDGVAKELYVWGQ